MYRIALNVTLWLEKNLKFTPLKWLEWSFKSFTKVGENFEIYTFEMARIAFKLSTMVGEIFEIYTSQMARISLK